LALAVLVAADGLVSGRGLLFQLRRQRLTHVQHVLTQEGKRRNVLVRRLSRRLRRPAVIM
jgi:demethoxyubiquinone hydroxylase (CLK1/Coq7/Cat5 family)